MYHRARQVLVSAVLSLFVFASAGQAAGMTPEDVARLRTVEEVAVSPDGTQVAYVLQVPRRPLEEDDGPAWQEIHLVGEDGKSRPFVSGEVRASDLSWTPDGKHLAFLAKRGDDEHKSLYTLPVDGGEARRVIDHGAVVDAFSFSPDGTRVAYVAEAPKDAGKKKLEEQGFKPEIYEEDDLPASVWIAALGADGPAAGERLEFEAQGDRGHVSEVYWSPAGDRLAVVLAPTPLIDDEYMARSLHILDTTGAAVGTIPHQGKIGDLVWSPDGSHLAFTGGLDLHDPSPGRLRVAPGQGGAAAKVVPGFVGNVDSFGWKDGETLIFVGAEGVQAGLYEVSRAGGEVRTLLGPEGHCLADLKVSPGGAAAALGSSPTHPDEVFRIDGATAQRITDSNPWLADLELGSQEVVEYTARDGETVQGLFIRPLGAGDGPWPLVLVVHGGPEAHYCNGWLTRYSLPGQMAAASGLATFYPNYRGSTGRGVDFAKAHQKDFAGKEFDDLVDGVDHLIEAGWVQKDKVGITGGSYGGFASAWGATYYSDRFAAAVMNVGISDQISKFGTTDISNEMFLVHQRMRPWEDWQFFLERSPIYYVERARTPILILHGAEDPRVHPSQSMELYRFLKVYGKTPVRLIFYPGEGHGNRKAAARYDYTLRLMRWMTHYLQGEGGDPPAYELDYRASLGLDAEAGGE